MDPAWYAELAWAGARNLLRHKLRSGLTLLGVVFGVGAVITMLGIGEGAQRTVLREIDALGLNNIIIESVQPPESGRGSPTSGRRMRFLLTYGLDYRDLARIQAALPNASLTLCHQVRQKVYYRGTRMDARVLGVPPEFFERIRTRVVAGRLFSDINESAANAVAVVTEPVNERSGAVGSLLGRTISIGRKSVEVIGIARMPSTEAGGMVFLPYNTARGMFGTITVKVETGSQEFSRNEIGQLIVTLPDERMVPDAVRVVRDLIAGNHSKQDVSITVPLDMLRAKQRTQRVMNLVLLAIATISLIVGGIGIMNIMLAIVTERIPEIGIRRAIGASRGDILAQFLAETVVLSTVGGIVGCLLGFVTVPLASKWTGWPGVITAWSVAASLAVSWLVGVVFGMAPAMRASRMNPIECLRYE